jgi:hypothetical protein
MSKTKKIVDVMDRVVEVAGTMSGLLFFAVLIAVGSTAGVVIVWLLS